MFCYLTCQVYYGDMTEIQNIVVLLRMFIVLIEKCEGYDLVYIYLSIFSWNNKTHFYYT